MFEYILPAVGMAAQIGGSLFGGGSSQPQFDYRAAGAELQRLREQLAEREEYGRLEAEERARQRGLIGVERGRQKGFTDETNKALNTQIARYDDIPGQVTARGAQLADYFGTNSGALPTNVMPKMRSAHTAASTADALADASAFNTAQNTALGKLRSVSDLFGDINRESLRDKTTMTNLADFKQGSKALLPAEIRPIVNRQAPQVTAGNFSQFYGPPAQQDNTFADILRGVGSVATSVGLSGWNPFGGGFSGAGGGWSTGMDGYGTRGMPRYGGPR